PVTGVGVERLTEAPSPVWLCVPSPQQYAAPADVNAQVWAYAVATCTKLNPPLTAVGVTCWVLTVWPSCPEKLLPQHHRAPAAVRPHTKSPAVEISVKVR